MGDGDLASEDVGLHVAGRVVVVVVEPALPHGDHLGFVEQRLEPVDAVNGIRIAFSPFLPFSAAVLDAALGEVDGWQRVPVPPGTPIEKPTPIFTKVDLDELLADD